MSDNNYNFSEIEERWRKIWAKNPGKRAKDFDQKPKHYHLIEFPYPSGAGLHVGNCMSYGASDAYVRMKRMQGFNVLFPIGWDAFGLPTENAAIKNKRKPGDITKENIDTFRNQMKMLAYSFDFDREVDTTDPNYYKWTQWIFLQFYKHAIVNNKLVEVADDDKTTPRLAFQAEMPINWCPSCKIGLANEEVIAGKCERCGTEVIKKIQKQWMLRITAYAERLIKDLDTVNYLDKIKTAQINWIGKSEGSLISFALKSERTIDLGSYTADTTTDKMLDALDKIKQALDSKGIKVWFNGTFGVAGYYGKLFTKPEDLDCGVLIKDFTEASSTLQALGYNILESKDNGKFKVNIFNAGEFKVEIGTFDRDLGDNRVKLMGHEFLAPDPAWFAECYRITAPKERRTGKNDLDRAEFLESLISKIEVFTTRADTLFGCTYVVLAPEHPLVQNIKSKALNLKEVEQYIENSKKKSDLERTDLAKDKTGVKLDGIKAINPINNEEIDVYVADYVLANYGTGAVMAVPAHDERDFEFAKKYNIPIKEVIIPKVIDKHDPPKDDLEFVRRDAVHAILINPKNNKVLCLEWKKFPWIGFIVGGIEEGEDIIEAAKREIIEESGYLNFKYIRTLGGAVESHFHAAHKGENRIATFHALVFELVDDKKNDLSQEEADKHEPVWLTWEELDKSKLIKPGEHYIWVDRFHNNEHSFDEYGVIINSDEFNGLDSEDGKKKITEKLKSTGSGDFTVNYKLRDWIFSRQHYWGEPIPIVHCDKCGMVPVSESDLPITLPDVKNYEPTNNGESPLANIDSWINVKCPKCGGNAKRETDTMPNWAGSSWYYLRYCDPNNDKELAAKDKLKYWTPVDLYNGGNEHTTLHLLYSRFWHKFLFDLECVPTAEPYQKRIAHGIILGADGRKMSKSFGNVINPDDIAKKFGVDVVRAYIMFIGPYDQESAWSMAGVQGIYRFLNRIYTGFNKINFSNEDSNELLVKLNQTIDGVSQDMEAFRMNTVVSKLMELNNVIEKQKSITKESYKQFVKMLSPVVPFLSSEIWNKLDSKKLLQEESWPEVDKNYLVAEKIEVVVQVNGKVRDHIEVDAGISDEELKKTALESGKVLEYIKDKEIVKTIVVPKKLVSIVLKNI